MQKDFYKKKKFNNVRPWTFIRNWLIQPLDSEEIFIFIKVDFFFLIMKIFNKFAVTWFCPLNTFKSLSYMVSMGNIKGWYNFLFPWAICNPSLFVLIILVCLLSFTWYLSGIKNKICSPIIDTVVSPLPTLGKWTQYLILHLYFKLGRLLHQTKC